MSAPWPVPPCSCGATETHMTTPLCPPWTPPTVFDLYVCRCGSMVDHEFSDACLDPDIAAAFRTLEFAVPTPLAPYPCFAEPLTRAHPAL